MPVQLIALARCFTDVSNPYNEGLNRATCGPSPAGGGNLAFTVEIDHRRLHANRSCEREFETPISFVVDEARQVGLAAQRILCDGGAVGASHGCEGSPLGVPFRGIENGCARNRKGQVPISHWSPLCETAFRGSTIFASLYRFVWIASAFSFSAAAPVSMAWAAFSTPSPYECA